MIVALPLFLVAVIGVSFSSPGPIFYFAERAGIRGKPFFLIKFRTMRIGTNSESAITGTHDTRIFPFGNFLRKTKIDELPQLLNVLKGDMSIVGPRPEDINIVKQHYSQLGMETLRLRPGIASPGSLFNYTHGDKYLAVDDPEEAYVKTFLPIKLSLEKVYIDNSSLHYDLNIIWRTFATIVKVSLGTTEFPLPKEYNIARQNKLF